MMKRTKVDRAHASGDPANDPYVDRTKFFDGEVHVQTVVGPKDSTDLEVLAVFFAAGARTRPHTHERDQVLHFIEGRGIVATESEKYHTEAGDVVTIPGGVWHWHGASRAAAACHISIRQPGNSNWEVDPGNWAAGYEDGA